MKKGHLLLVVLLSTTFLPTAPALGAPTIAFLNPSGYSSPVTISDITDQDGFVHLVAWAKEAPTQSLVEFELQPSGQSAATFTADRVTVDTWEAFIPIANSYPDTSGYALTARLYEGVPGDADEVTSTQIIVEVDQSDVPPPTAETVEMTYPGNGEPLGFFRPPGQRPNALVDYQASLNTGRVRAFYTQSLPGFAPVWEVCGTSTPAGGGAGRVRCTLGTGDALKDVTAVAVLSNKGSPSADYNPALDDTGDAHRVYPYVQQPTDLQLASTDTPMVGTCSFLTATVSDQFVRPIAGANVDVHAQGPTDGLRFMSSPGKTSPFQPPNTGHALKEDAKRCSNNESFRRQADHNNPDGPDAKHVESVKGTTNLGEFLIGLRNPAPGDTKVRAWVDRNGDDTKDNGEPAQAVELDW
jgi:hypothetical protein